MTSHDLPKREYRGSYTSDNFKLTFVEFNKFNMITSVRFCLVYGLLNRVLLP